jgi:hypothetical protein
MSDHRFRAIAFGTAATRQSPSQTSCLGPSGEYQLSRGEG